MSKTLAPLVLPVLLAAAFGPALAAGRVDVSYDKPEQFSDIGRGSFDREHNLATLTAYLQDLGRQLPDGQLLKLVVSDVDLAGELEFKRGQEIRVLRGRADWPRMTLQYTLSAEGRTLKQDQARLADMSYMFPARNLEDPPGPLSYEKRMLRKWFDETFVAPQ